MIDELSQGKVVQFGNLGNFQVGIRSKGEDVKEYVSSYSATSTHMNFRPTNGLREMMKVQKYKMIED